MEVSDCRKRIDEIDDALLALFKERIELSEEVARAKDEQNQPLPAPARAITMELSCCDTWVTGIIRLFTS